MQSADYLRMLDGHDLTQLHPCPRLGQPDQALQLPRLRSDPPLIKQRKQMALLPAKAWWLMPLLAGITTHRHRRPRTAAESQL